MTPASTRTMNLAQFAVQSARRFPDRDALIRGDKRWNWAGLMTRVNAMAHALQTEYGVQKGDRIVVQSTNCNQMFESMLACFTLGAVWVPANFRGMPDDLHWIVKSSGAVGLICHADFPEHAATCAPDLRFTIGIDTGKFGRDYDQIVTASLGHSAAMASVDRDDPCWFFYTSGTTGRPKASVLTHGQMGFVVTNHLCDLMPGTTQADTSLVVAPLSHGAGVHALNLIARGAASVLPTSAKFDPEEIWQLVQTHRITNIFTVPTILKLLTESEAVDRFDHTSLRYVIYAGAPMYRVDQVHALNKLGPVLVQYFGLGEVTGNITVLPPSEHSATHDPRPGTCGYARTGIQIEIQSPDGTALPPGETGEICVIGPAVFAGYWDNPRANEKAFRDGWFRTGDLGHMDEAGYLTITGRESDMYISGGSNIYPREIEDKILSMGSLAEVAIIGIPDPKWGEVGVAICVAKPGKSPSAQQVLDHLEPLVASYKMPRQIEFWDALPKSAYGKITKKLVREAYFDRQNRP